MENVVYRERFYYYGDTAGTEKIVAYRGKLFIQGLFIEGVYCIIMHEFCITTSFIVIALRRFFASAGRKCDPACTT